VLLLSRHSALGYFATAAPVESGTRAPAHASRERATDWQHITLGALPPLHQQTYGLRKHTRDKQVSGTAMHLITVWPDALLLLLLYVHLQASDVLALMLDLSSKRGAALRAAMPGGVPPALPQLFSVGQFVRCVVAQLTTTAGGGDQDEAAAAADAGAGEQRAHGVVAGVVMGAISACA
jgi:hypothetical protein